MLQLIISSSLLNRISTYPTTLLASYTMEDLLLIDILANILDFINHLLEIVTNHNGKLVDRILLCRFHLHRLFLQS